MEGLIHVKNCFKINRNVYNKTEEGLCSILRQSIGKYEDDLNLQEYSGHMSYITNFANYANKFECNRCEKIFRRRHMLHIHRITNLNDWLNIFHFVLVFVPIFLDIKNHMSI